MSEPIALSSNRGAPVVERSNKVPLSEERSIGKYLQSVRRLSEDQLARIGEHQRLTGLRFGEAAVALNMVTEGEVLWALSQQFDYPMADAREAISPELVVATDPLSRAAEVFRDLRSQLVMGVMNPKASKRGLVLVGAEREAGCTFFAVNLALSFSQMGARTLLIDANLRKPRVHRLLKVNPDRGLSSVLMGRMPFGADRPLKAFPGLHVLPAGVVPPNPLELLQSASMDVLLNDALAHFDFVLLDTPAHALGADARVIASKAGAAMVVGRRAQSPLGELKRLVQALGRPPVALAGLVMNEA